MEVLRVICENAKNSENDLNSEILKLFGRLSSKFPLNAEIWNFYALASTPEKTENNEKNWEKWEKSLRFRQKSCQILSQNEKSTDFLTKFVDFSSNLADFFLKCDENFPEKTKIFGPGVRLTLKSALVQIEKNSNEEKIENFEILKEKFIKIENLCKQ